MNTRKIDVAVGLPFAVIFAAVVGFYCFVAWPVVLGGIVLCLPLAVFGIHKAFHAGGPTTWVAKVLLVQLFLVLPIVFAFIGGWTLVAMLVSRRATRPAQRIA